MIFSKRSKADAVDGASVQIMCPVTEKDIQEHVRLRLEAERKEKELRKKEKLEAHLFTVVKLVRDSDIQEQIGSARWFDLAASDKVSSFLGALVKVVEMQEQMRNVC